MAGATYIADSPEGGHSRHLVGYVLVLTLAGGVLLGLIGGWWGRTPAGNTALVVPFAGGSALAAAAWIALTLGLRHHETSGARLALGAGLGGLAALATSLAAIFMPVLGATSRAVPDPVMSTLGAAAWHLTAAVAGILLAHLLGHPLARPARVLIGIAIVLSSALVALLAGSGALLEPFLLPLLVALPLLAGRPPNRHPGGLVWVSVLWITILPAILAGVLVGNSLAGFVPPG